MERATIRFQRRNGLAADGVVGRRTLRAIRMRDAARLAARESTGQPRALESPAPRTPEPTPSAQTPAQPGDAPTTERDIPWMAIALLAAIAGGGLLAVSAQRRRRPAQAVVEMAPRRELVAQSETSLPPRFTRPADLAAERRAHGAGRGRSE
jgi:hypothetical protein